MQVFHNDLNWVFTALSKDTLHPENKVNSYLLRLTEVVGTTVHRLRFFSVITLVNPRGWITVCLLLKNSLLHFLIFLGPPPEIFLWQISLLFFWENTDRKFGGSIYGNQEPLLLPGNLLIVLVKFVMVSQSLDRFTWAVFSSLLGDQFL